MNERYFLDIELTELLENFEFKNTKRIKEENKRLKEKLSEQTKEINEKKCDIFRLNEKVGNLKLHLNVAIGKSPFVEFRKGSGIFKDIDTDSVEPITYHFVSTYGDSEPLTLNQFIDGIIHRRYNSSTIDYKIKKGNTTSIGTLYESLLVKLTPIKLKEYLWKEGQRL